MRFTSQNGQKHNLCSNPRWVPDALLRRLLVFLDARRRGAAFLRADFLADLEAGTRLRPGREPELVFFAAML